MRIVYDRVHMPKGHENYLPVNLTLATMEEHRQKVLEKMREKVLLLVKWQSGQLLRRVQLSEVWKEPDRRMRRRSCRKTV